LQAEGLRASAPGLIFYRNKIVGFSHGGFLTCKTLCQDPPGMIKATETFEAPEPFSPSVSAFQHFIRSKFRAGGIKSPHRLPQDQRRASVKSSTTPHSEPHKKTEITQLTQLNTTFFPR
jgi:hypothetical protein